jgi:hypothetical protein
MQMITSAFDRKHFLFIPHGLRLIADGLHYIALRYIPHVCLKLHYIANVCNYSGQKCRKIYFSSKRLLNCILLVLLYFALDWHKTETSFGLSA